MNASTSLVAMNLTLQCEIAHSYYRCIVAFVVNTASFCAIVTMDREIWRYGWYVVTDSMCGATMLDLKYAKYLVTKHSNSG